VLSAGHYAEKVEAFAAGLLIPGLTLSCVREPEPLGTGGGFLHSLRGSGDTTSDVLVCNGDSLLLTELAPVFAALGDPNVDGAIISVRVADASRFGTIRVSNDDRLLGFAEKRPSAGLVNGGVYLFRRTTIARFPEKKLLSFEYDVFPSLLADGARIAVVPCDAPFLDIGTEDSLAHAGVFIRDNMRWFR
jgi:D-glycero-alpha-D-manno-heptose 1-phosphate guanylyltransferase